jgi:solute carrier family 12 sodium/potassium/chloride transporter 2
MGLLVILLAAMVDFFVGAIMGPQSALDRAKGWEGLNGNLSSEKVTIQIFICFRIVATILMGNLGPGYKVSDGIQQDFFSIFSIFFPAVAGIQAGKFHISINDNIYHLKSFRC